MKRSSLIALIAAASLALLAACTAESLDEVTPVAGVTEVAVKDDFYEPRVIRVPAGTEVTWIWEGSSRHNVVGDDGVQSDVVREGTFTHTYNTPGTFNYICTLHGGMTGRVIVE